MYHDIFFKVRHYFCQTPPKIQEKEKKVIIPFALLLATLIRLNHVEFLKFKVFSHVSKRQFQISQVILNYSLNRCYHWHFYHGLSTGLSKFNSEDCFFSYLLVTGNGNNWKKNRSTTFPMLTTYHKSVTTKWKYEKPPALKRTTSRNQR